MCYYLIIMKIMIYERKRINMDHQYDNLTILLLFISINCISIIMILMSYLINNITGLKNIINYKKIYFFNLLSLIICNPNILHYYLYISYNDYFWFILLILSLILVIYTISLNFNFLKKFKKYQNLDDETKLSIKSSNFIFQLNIVSLIVNIIYNFYLAFYI